MINEKIMASSDDSSYTFGSPVNIASRTASNPYVCPSDGYVRWTDSTQIYVQVNSSSLLNNDVSKYASVFVRKGMRVNFTATPSSGIFIPIVKSS